MSTITQTSSLASPSHLSSRSSSSSISEWDVKPSTPSSSLRLKNQESKSDLARLQKISILKEKKKRGESVGNDELEEFDDELRDWINQEDSDQDETGNKDTSADPSSTQHRLGSSNDAPTASPSSSVDNERQGNIEGQATSKTSTLVKGRDGVTR
ncbi:unnamed protein product [Sympodiomycopsis kandeliae]